MSLKISKGAITHPQKVVIYGDYDIRGNETSYINGF